jgi:NAD(P) transhydrogenase subunit alpha
MGHELTIGVLKEMKTGEMRVAVAPEAVVRILKLGAKVTIESGAGEKAGFSDEAYEKAGASIAASSQSVLEQSQVVIRINPPTDLEISQLRSGQMLVSFLSPATRPDLLKQLKDKKITALSLESIPRTSRAQKMDVLSSMANIAGYRAIIEAANEFGRFFTGQITAAGKVPPAKVLVIGAGVAGLSAIGAARSLGAIVRAFDTRPAVKDQVKSMGAEFLEILLEEDGSGSGGYAKEMSKEFIEAEMALFLAQAKDVDIIVTTALIPGKPAPRLITREMVEAMKPGSIIVDLAAAQGGNCELTQPDKVVNFRGVKIIGYTDLTSRLANQSSQLLGNNIFHLLSDIIKDGILTLNLEDEIQRGATVTHNGEILWPPPPLKQPPEQKIAAKTLEAVGKEKASETKKSKVPWTALLILGTLTFLGMFAPPAFLSHFGIFVLACVIGWLLVWNVTPALHTPLMSVTNAISGIIIIGAIVQLGGAEMNLSTGLALVAVLIASINIAGGFLVTKRMLKMFRR